MYEMYLDTINIEIGLIKYRYQLIFKFTSWLKLSLGENYEDKKILAVDKWCCFSGHDEQ
jgi:hypothetical protein